MYGIYEPRSELSVAHVTSGYRSMAKRSIAVVMSTVVREQVVDTEASEPMLPSVSNGLPPPLLSFRFICEFPLEEEEEELEEEVAVGAVEVSTSMPLLDSPLAADVDGAKLVAVAVPLRTAVEEDPDVEDEVSVEEGRVADAELTTRAVVVAEVFVAAAALVLCESPPSTDFALEHKPSGPPPARKVAMMLPPSMPLFPHAVFTLEVYDTSASIHPLLHEEERKSDAEQPLMDDV